MQPARAPSWLIFLTLSALCLPACRDRRPAAVTRAPDARAAPPAPRAPRPKLPDVHQATACPSGTQARRDNKTGWGDMLLERWCQRPDKTRHGPRVWWSVPDTSGVEQDSLARAIKQGRLTRVQWYRDGAEHGLSVRYFEGPAARALKGKNVISTFGQLSQGRLHGQWFLLYPDQAVLRVMSYKDGVRHGPWAEHHQDGTAWVEGQYKQGLRHGRWRHWDARGRLLATHQLRAGSGAWSEWYPSGRKQAEGTLRANWPHGSWIVWHENGARAARLSSDQGAKPGKAGAQYWDATGAALPLTWQATAPGAAPGEEAMIRRVIRRHINELRYCYQKELQARPLMRGKLTVRFTIAPGGQVLNSEQLTEGTTLNSTIAARCMTRAHSRWLFPTRAVPAPLQVTMPYILDRVAPARLHRDHGLWPRRTLLGSLLWFSASRYGRLLLSYPLRRPR